MDYAANQYDAPFKRFLGYSAWLHIGLVAAVALSVWIQRSGNPWGGIGGGAESSTKVNLVSSAGIPMPHPVVPTPSQVVDPTKGLAEEEPKIEPPSPPMPRPFLSSRKNSRLHRLPKNPKSSRRKLSPPTTQPPMAKVAAS
jgi:hypothetical protein